MKTKMKTGINSIHFHLDLFIIFLHFPLIIFNSLIHFILHFIQFLPNLFHYFLHFSLRRFKYFFIMYIFIKTWSFLVLRGNLFDIWGYSISSHLTYHQHVKRNLMIFFWEKLSQVIYYYSLKNGPPKGLHKN